MAAATTFPEIVISGIEVEELIIALVSSARAAVSSAKEKAILRKTAQSYMVDVELPIMTDVEVET